MLTKPNRMDGRRRFGDAAELAAAVWATATAPGSRREVWAEVRPYWTYPAVFRSHR